MKTDEEIKSIQDQFNARILEQERKSKQFFYKLLIIVLGIFLAGAIVGYFLSK